MTRVPEEHRPGLRRSAPPPPALKEVLDVERVDDALFRGLCVPGRGDRLFGGEVAGQALVAACRTAPADRAVHSAHAYFLLGGDPDRPVEYRVTPSRDGGSFSTRHVTAEQGGRIVFELIASFQRPESGLEHHPLAPEAPAPEEVADVRARLDGVPRGEAEWLERVSRNRGYELRFPEGLPRFVLARRTGDPGAAEGPAAEGPAADGAAVEGPAADRTPRQRFWMRADEPLPDDPVLHAGALMYASDLMLLSVSLGPHRMSFADAELQSASLDHAVWFHAPHRMDEWTLYAQESPWAASGRSLCTGRMFDRDGRLVASVSQEALIRRRA